MILIRSLNLIIQPVFEIIIFQLILNINITTPSFAFFVIFAIMTHHTYL